MNEWEEWVLLGDIGKEYANTLCGKENMTEELERFPELELKLEFKAPSYDVARVVEDVYNHWITDPHKYLQDLADYYGYKLEKR